MSNNHTVDSGQLKLFNDRLVDISENIVISCYVVTALWGAFTVLIGASTYSLKRWGSSSAHTVMLSTTIVMYIMSTVLWAMRIRLIWLELVVLLPGMLVPTAEASKDKPVSLILVVAQTAPLTLNIILSDIIVLWRVCIIWSKNRVVVGISCILSALIIVSYIVFSTREIAFELGDDSPETDTNVIGPLAFSASLFSNLWATSMVGYKAWRYNGRIQHAMAHTSRTTATEYVFALLTESGAIYALIWIFYFIDAFGTGILGVYGSYVSSSMSQITGIYPTIIFLLVALEKTRLGESLSASAQLTSHRRTFSQPPDLKLTIPPPSATSGHRRQNFDFEMEDSPLRLEGGVRKGYVIRSP